MLLAIAGCVSQRIIWAPDGKQAAVIADDGLYLCDAQGNLSGLLAPGATRAAWFKDSRRLAFVRVDRCTNWNGLTSLLKPQVLEGIRQDAAGLAAKFRSRPAKEVVEAEKKEVGKDILAVRMLYLRDQSPKADLKSIQADAEWKDIEADVSTLVVATVGEGALQAGPSIAAEIGSVEDVRVSPTGAGIAFTVPAGKGARLLVCGSGAGAPARVITSRCAEYPDWSADGNSLVYIAAANTNCSDDVLLAVLTRRQVFDGAGQWIAKPVQDELAGLLFNEQTRVRCLRDGRILFSSEEWRLPVTTNDLPQRQQLFALDPERQSTLTPLVPRGTHEQLPAGLSFFEVSPDDKRVAFGGDKGMVAVLTLASGNVEVLQNSSDTELKSVPSWRSATELCYVGAQESKTNAIKWEVMLAGNGKTNVISRQWPEQFRKGLLD
jgi:hypothetical protein